MSTFPVVQCLTMDGLALPHEAQVRALCDAGAESVQLRMKSAGDEAVAAVASACLPVCRDAGCRLIINDRVHVALRVGADGVHLGKRDMPWEEAAALIDGRLSLGGTVNSVADAERAAASGVLDYVGVGPFRFTHTKQNLAAVLTPEDWRAILTTLGSIPAYAIGGIGVADVAAIRALGCAGIAVCSQLYRAGAIQENYDNFTDVWNHTGAVFELER